jgi:hypothetical protein
MDPLDLVGQIRLTHRPVRLDLEVLVILWDPPDPSVLEVLLLQGNHLVRAVPEDLRVLMDQQDPGVHLSRVVLRIRCRQ